MAEEKADAFTGSEIAIIGMSCRLPGAADVEQFWRNLSGGVESLTLLTDEELARAGVDPAVYGNPNYVRRVSVLDGVEMFDPAFFGYTPLEAKIMDPQHRLFLECAWEVFEQAGYDPETYPSPVGVFTGAKTNTYLFSLFSNREFFRGLDNFQIALGNDLASMATRVSYKLNLRGPSYALHTACSTSLVAVHLACQSLLLDECRMAVAGGAAVNVPHRKGYLAQKGGILSPDGSCRTFDAGAAGSNFGNGAGAVLLKRLEDALADGDHIAAVIRGSATNNDGARKASYTAPGVEGQTAVLLEAMAAAGVTADDISYVEAHGTATDLGDSIEMLALSEAFRADTARKRFCAVGSVKTNIGHLETAAGVAGLIKTALALEHRQIPPSLHFTRPNPKIDFENSPFFVNTELADWPSDGRPRRAGLSSFGIGSTNAHVILEEPPAPAATTPATRPFQLLLLSARTPSALEAMTANLARHLEASPGADVADVAYTLQVGRKGFQHRRAVVCPTEADPAAAAAALRAEDGARRTTGDRGAADRGVVFLFPGLGDHYVDMGLGLYQTEPVFRAAIDRCAELLRPELGADLRELLYPRGAAAAEAVDAAGKTDFKRLLGRGTGEDDPAARRLQETRFAQPATFAVEYALAQVWMELGVRPQAMIGYSVGEYVAACLAGVLSLEDALKLVARRARLIQELPAGAMTAAPLAEEAIAPRLARHGLSLAALNGPAVSVAAGPEAGIAALERELAAEGVVCRRLPTTHAFHSAMMEPLAGELTELARTVERKPPQIPYLSNVTGTWITAAEAADPGYWARHMCGPVRFADGVGELLREGERIFLEVGPGQSLGSFVRLHPDCGKERGRLVVASMRAAHGGRPSQEVLLAALGQLWVLGAPADWRAFHAGERRRRVPLPTYPFERQAYWIDPDGVAPAAPAAEAAARHVTLDKQADIADWFYRPVWKPAPAPEAVAAAGPWLILADRGGLGRHLAERLRREGRTVWTVEAGEGPVDYAAVLSGVTRGGPAPAGIVHLWSLDAPPAVDEEGFRRSQELGFNSLLALAQAVGRLGLRDTLRLTVVSGGIFAVTGHEALAPERATMVGPCRVIPQEIARVACRLVDLDPGELGGNADGLAAQIAAELVDAPEAIVALRGGERLVQDFEAVRLGAPEPAPRLRERGVYLLTGGVGGLGLAIAEYLARAVQARLVLTGRSPLPEREAWAGWLESHPGDDPVSARLRALLALEALGAEVLAVSVDVTDETAMRALIDEARRRFGRIDGVIHLAGTPGGGILQLKTPAAAERIMAPKVRGARVLETIFRDDPPDFLVLFSSIASILGEFGQVDYCGANAYLDAVAERNAAAGGPLTMTIDWDIWREVGLAVYTEVPAHLKPWRQEMLEKAILTREGVDAFARILGAGLPHVIVSAQELHGRIELGKSFSGESFLRELEKAGSGGARPAAAPAVHLPAGPGGLERRIAEIWQRVLGVGQVGLQDNFFDLGGNSLLGLQIVSEMTRDLGVEIAPVTLFESPTVSALARHLAPPAAAAGGVVDELAERRRRARGGTGEGAGTAAVAIIGMAGRFPGAPDVDALWSNLRAGVESVTFFSDEELLAAGADPEVLKNPRYVRAGSILDGIDLFDAGLFGYSPREAEVMDPQHRIFLECAWELFDQAGWDPEAFPGRIGVFAGSNLSTYLLRMYADPDVRSSVNMLQAILGNDKDSLTTTVSYKLNLRGPSVAVQTFCSTSLVAVHMACQSLRQGECDMAMAGGIRVVVPDHMGYVWEPGGIAPSDGHSRSFDAKANGSILGHGVGAVLLKRLDDALADGDHIHAVIRGTAINNDGSLKAGYTAPSVAGQADAIAAVFEEAGIDPASIGYVEAHGSATELGDPIEVTALTRAFRRWTDARNFCPIGSVKSNFGHLDRAAGVTGLIKTVLALEHGEIPPSINFDEPNPQIDFANSPFFVNTELRPWKTDGAPRRAAVNSLGMGGTNAHLILEEAPAVETSGPSRPWQLLVLSARSGSALDAATANLASHLESHPDLSLADAAFTLQAGRRGLEHRRMVVCRDLPDAVDVLRGGDPRRLFTAWREEGERPVVFLFSGLGGQYVDMGRGLYESEPTFRAEIDRCCLELQPLLGVDLRTLIYPAAAAETGAAGSGVDLRKMLRRGSPGAGPLDETRFAQPALFVLEYALARLWMEWGIRPQAVAGYSVGEYVAACLAGVLSLSDALALVAERARRIQDLPAGAMLAVGLPEEAVLPLLGAELSLAAVNGPEQTVVAGPVAAIAELEGSLAARDVACRRLAVTHAFHSRMMEPAFDALVERVRRVTLSPPELPLLSNLTGRWMTAEEAVDPTYWSRHMCGTVRFAESVAELLSEPDRVFLEIGPGPTLASLVLQHPAARRETGRETVVLPTVRHSYETQPDGAYALTTLGKLWLLGVRVDWAGFAAHERRRRVVLPAYPFERQRYWIDTVVDGSGAGRRKLEAGTGAHLYTPSWRRSSLPAMESAPTGRSWLILADSRGLGDRLAEGLRAAGAAVAITRPGEVESWAALLDSLGEAPDRIVHLWSFGDDEADFERRRELAFAAPLALARELGARGGDVRLWAVADGLLEVDGDEALKPEAAILLGACRAISEHLPRIDCRILDVPPPGPAGARLERLAGLLRAEFAAGAPERLIAYRGSHRWVPLLDELPAASPRPPQGGLCLLAGGLEAPGHPFARHLAAGGARLLLLEPAGFPAREEWDEWLRGDAEGLVGRRLARVRDLEALGAEVEVAAVDLADEAALEAAVAAVEERWGAVQGLVLASSPAPAAEGALADGNGHLGARVRGVLALDDLRRRRSPDFAFLVAPRGADAVDAAEAFFLDTLAAASGGGWTSVAWGLGSGGEAAVARLFAAGSAAQIVAAARPLSPGWSGLEGLPAEEREEARAAVGFYPRPMLRVDFVPPRNPTEEHIAKIWKDLLGVAQVGVYDNFLDLGGDSLLATRLVSRMRDVFHLDLPVRLFFERSTVAELAQAVEELSAQRQEEQETEILQQVQMLSEEDLEKEIMRLESLLAETEKEVANG